MCRVSDSRFSRSRTLVGFSPAFSEADLVASQWIFLASLKCLANWPGAGRDELESVVGKNVHDD